MNRQTLEVPMRVSASEVSVPMQIGVAVIAPIPKNYGLITWDGRVITVS